MSDLSVSSRVKNTANQIFNRIDTSGVDDLDLKRRARRNSEGELALAIDGFSSCRRV
jgi:hypothetical protein